MLPFYFNEINPAEHLTDIDYISFFSYSLPIWPLIGELWLAFPRVDAKGWEDVKKSTSQQPAYPYTCHPQWLVLILEILDSAGFPQDRWGNERICGKGKLLGSLCLSIRQSSDGKAPRQMARARWRAQADSRPAVVGGSARVRTQEVQVLEG